MMQRILCLLSNVRAFKPTTLAEDNSGFDKRIKNLRLSPSAH